MKNKLICATLATALALIPISASAQNAPTQAAPPVVNVVVASPVDLDPARLAAAKIAVGHIFPNGTYARMMNGTFTTMMDQMMDSMGQMPIKELAKLGGLKEADLAKLGKTSLNEIMEIIDPSFKQRMGLISQIMIPELVKIMSDLEPGMQEALSRAYAKRFNAQQLADMNRFFETPSGHEYASQAMLLTMDPEMVARIQEMMPKVVEHMPVIIGKITEAEDKLPKRRRFTELSQEERVKLAKLLGISEQELNQSETRGNSSGKQSKRS